MTDKKELLTEHCYECGNCVRKCPVNAIRLEKPNVDICLPVIDTENVLIVEYAGKYVNPVKP